MSKRTARIAVGLKLISDFAGHGVAHGADCGSRDRAGLFHGASLSAQTRPHRINDYAKITSVSDPQISPDGKTIVFFVSRPNLDQDRSDRELVLIEIGTGAQHVLTYERKGVGSPRWSPTGDRLAFVATDGAGKDAKPQVFILPMAGGEPARLPRRRTALSSLPGGPTGRRSPT